MALGIGDVLLAATSGGAKALSDAKTKEREARQERVKERAKMLQELALERAKTVHTNESKQYQKRYDNVESVRGSEGSLRTYNFFKNVQGLDDDMARSMALQAEQSGWSPSDEELDAYVGPAPTFNFRLPEYEDKSVLSSEDEFNSLMSQIASNTEGTVTRTPIRVPFSPKLDEVTKQTAAMQNREANAALLRKMNPELTEDESMIMAYQIEMAKTTPGMAGVVSPVDYFVRGAGGFEKAAAQRAEEQAIQPSVSTKEAMALVNIYMDQNPYGGAIENQDQYVSDLADLARNISAGEKIPFSEARSIAEEMLLPDTSLIKSGDSWVPNIIEENYSYNPDQKISYETIKRYKKTYPGRSIKEIIRAIRNQRTQGK